MIRCEECRPLLSLLIDGELHKERIAEVDAHVRSCASCTAYARELRALDEALDNIPEPEIPLSLKLNLRAIERADLKQSQWAEWKRAAVYAALAGAILVAGAQFPGAVELTARLLVMIAGYFLLMSGSLRPADGSGV
jgi:anti-sigma factor RsiW